MIDDQIAWQAVLNRDRNFDDQFVTGVLTTGIYCRPSCAAKHPMRKNVRFFATCSAARDAGLRSCKRCLPDEVQRDRAAIAMVLDALENSEVTPKLSQLAILTGYSASHLQRIFKRDMRISPAVYGRAWRNEKVKDALKQGMTITQAIYEAGYDNASTFYAQKGKYDDMNVSAWRNGGEGTVIHWTVAKTSLGDMLIAATDKGVCRLAFDEGKEAFFDAEQSLIKKFPNAQFKRDNAEFASLFVKVVAAVESADNYDDIALDVAGTDFQQAIWQELRLIPRGETRSYSDLAAAVGKPKAVRAAGSANGANNVAVLIPCHRVVRSDGSLGGYAYGLNIKEKLLKKEMI